MRLLSSFLFFLMISGSLFAQEKRVLALHQIKTEWELLMALKGGQLESGDPKRFPSQARFQMLTQVVPHLHKIDFNDLKITTTSKGLILQFLNFPAFEVESLGRLTIKVNGKSFEPQSPLVRAQLKRWLDKSLWGQVSKQVHIDFFFFNRAYAKKNSGGQARNDIPITDLLWPVFGFVELFKGDKLSPQERTQNQNYIKCLPTVLPYYKAQLDQYCQSIEENFPGGPSSITDLKKYYTSLVTPMKTLDSACEETSRELSEYFRSHVITNGYTQIAPPRFFHTQKTHALSPSIEFKPMTESHCLRWQEDHFNLLPGLNREELRKDSQRHGYSTD